MTVINPKDGKKITIVDTTLRDGDSRGSICE